MALEQIWKLEYVENTVETQVQSKFCHDEGLSYVSASPHRIPIAIVAAAQAAIEQPKKVKRRENNTFKPPRLNHN